MHGKLKIVIFNTAGFFSEADRSYNLVDEAA
jgi:hypothetical protein